MKSIKGGKHLQRYKNPCSYNKWNVFIMWTLVVVEQVYHYDIFSLWAIFSTWLLGIFLQVGSFWPLFTISKKDKAATMIKTQIYDRASFRLPPISAFTVYTIFYYLNFTPQHCKHIPIYLLIIFCSNWTLNYVVFPWGKQTVCLAIWTILCSVNHFLMSLRGIL